MIDILITPVPKPRQTKSDKWQKRPSVMRYRAFADKLRLLSRIGARGLPDMVSEGAAILFVMPVPRSWSKKKKLSMAGSLHESSPDIDNLIKAFLDALMKDDSGVSIVAAKKVWGESGRIQVMPFDWPSEIK